MKTFLMLLLLLVAIFLILIILVQRGKGGGLAGAFGGMGGQSAFGTRAGDTFTWITIGVAGLWILLCITTVIFVSNANRGGTMGAAAATETGDSGLPGDSAGESDGESTGDDS